MAEIKIPKLLHKMSVAHQKAWYKKNNMPLPSHLTGAEGKSAAQAKKDVGQINKQKAKEKEVAAAKVDRIELIKRAVEKRASRTQIAKLRSAFGGEVPGARYDDPIAMARAGIPIRGYRLGESSKPDASMAMTDQLKMKMISNQDKMTLAKVAALMSSAKNKDKKNEYVRQLGLKAMKAGAIDPARGHSPTRFGREALKKEEVEQVDEAAKTKKEKLKALLYRDRSNVREFGKGAGLTDAQKAAARKAIANEEVEQIDETNGEYNKLGQPKPGSVDVDPTPGDVLPSYKKRKPAMYKPKNHVAEDSESVNELKGDSIELEGSVMNEITKKEAEAMFGGPVKVKPKMPAGKQPEGYRYVRSLARKAMKAGLKKEEVKDAADVGEYDYEGDMAKSQLRSIMANSKRMHDMLEENTNLPEWVQSKITLAEDYIVTAANYMEGEMNEEFTEEELAELAEAKMTDAQMKKREKYVKSMKPVSDWEKRYPGRGEQVMYATATKMAMKEEEQIDEFVDRETRLAARKAETGSSTRVSSGDVLGRRGGHETPKDAIARRVGKDSYGIKSGGKTSIYNRSPKPNLPEEVEQVDEAKAVTHEDPLVTVHDKDGMMTHANLSTANHIHGTNVKHTDVHAGPVKVTNSDNNKMTFELSKNHAKMVREETEGTVAVTPKEKSLAAHHGDKTKITYGDVIKARIKSAAEKAMKKGK